jgi:hypothetical protein
MSTNGILQATSNIVANFTNDNSGILNFDGTEDYVSTTTQYNTTDFPNFSIGCWFRTTDSNSGKLIGFENTQTSITSSSYDRQLYVGSNGRLTFGTWNSTTFYNTISSPQLVNDNYWYYAVGTYDGTTMKLYIDGVKVAEAAAPTPLNYLGWWRIGGYKLSGWQSGSDGYYSGKIAGAHVYNAALTDANVLSNYLTRKSRYKTTQNPTISITASTHNSVSGTINDALDSSGNFASSYQVQRATSLAGDWTTLQSTTKTFIDSTVVASTNYFYRTRFIQNNGKNSDWGLSAEIRTLQTPTGNLPVPVLDLTPMSKSEIFADVIVPSGQIATSYAIERASTSSGPWTQISTSSAELDKNLNTNTAYYYRAKYSTNVGQSDYNSPVLATTFNPQPLTSQQLRDAGYVLVTDYGADPTGVADSTVAIQNAINAAARKAVWFPSGTYTISDTIRCYSWEVYPNTSTGLTARHTLIGAHSGERPKFKIATNAPLFDNLLQPRPMVSFINFRYLNDATAATAIPNYNTFHPFERPSGYRYAHGNLFDATFCNIDLDTSGHVAAVGLHMPACQNSITNNIKVTATGSLCGFWHLPNAGSPAVNIEVVGGQYGIRFDAIRYFGGSASSNTLLESGSGVSISGVKLSGQTVQCLVTDDYSPLVIVGFDFQPASTGVAWGPQGNLPSVNFGISNPNFSVDNFSLIDGKIVQSTGIVFNNVYGKTIYLKNVYVSGTNSLTRYKTRTTVSGTGAWKLIREYCSVKEGAYPYDYTQFEATLHHYSIIDGIIANGNTNPEPIITISNDVSAPPSDLVTKHYPEQFPCVDNGPCVFVPFTPVPLSGPLSGAEVYPRDRVTGLPTSSWANIDNRAAVQTAIDQAQAAGHGRVFLGGGRIYIGAPLILRSKTKLMGTGLGRTRVCASSFWVPTSGYVFMITTDNYKNATTSLSFLSIDTPRLRGSFSLNSTTGYDMYTGDRFSGIHWRAGRHSKIGHIYLEREYLENILRHPMNYMYLTDNGGGRHYGIGADGRGNSGRKYRAVRMESTTEPTHFYAFNLEAGKSTSNLIFTPETNAELINCKNVRIYGTKREGDASTIIITDCDNIAYYSAGGAMLTTIRYGEVPSSHIYVKGSSTNILITLSQPQQAVSFTSYNIVDRTLPAISGTVTVNGTVVTGTGTSFTTSLSSGVLGSIKSKPNGDISSVRFNNSVISVNGIIKEVVDITNNTQLTVNSAFSGVSTTTQYGLFRIPAIKHTEVLAIYKKGSINDDAMW